MRHADSMSANRRSSRASDESESFSTRVAIVIPICNEAATLSDTLGSLAQQDYPHALMEILIVDGGSTDGWRSALPDSDRLLISLRVLNNPNCTSSAAVNLALRSTDAETILWIGGHCLLSSNYVRATVLQFDKNPNSIPGGRLEVAGNGFSGQLNGMVLTSPFGTGLGSHRFGKDVGPSVPLAYSLLDRQRLVRVGGFDERLVRNQDNDILARLQRDGAQFHRVDAEATYVAPSKFKGLWSRAWGNGCWNIWGQRIRRGGVSWWHYAPMAMVGLGAALSTASFFWFAAQVLLAGAISLYVCIAVWEAIRLSLKKRILWPIPFLPVAFLAYHVIYGLGSWSALFRRRPDSI